MKNKIEATKFLEEKLNEIYFIDCDFISNHGVNMYFTLNVNKVDLSKRHPDELFFYDKEENWIMDYDKKTNIFWLSYDNISLSFEFDINEQEKRDLIKDVLETYFKFKVEKIDYI